MKKLFFLVLSVLFVSQISGQGNMEGRSGILPQKEKLALLRKAIYVAAPQRSAAKKGSIIFDTAQWAHHIDSIWGKGMADSEKIAIFNEFWLSFDSNYAGFIHLPWYNWDSIVKGMRAEILRGVSKGRFAGIIGHLMEYINDWHSSFYDLTVDYYTYVSPGLPVFRSESGKFGACITTLHDTLAMVYDADTNQPFGLKPGDIILGYNGIPWTKLVKIILKYQLPNAGDIGSTDSATFHRNIQAAGESWYLFDTINIRKCDGTLKNFPTSLMIGTNFTNFCTEQMPVRGIHKVSYYDYVYSGMSVSSGVVKGTRTGYVYMYDCEDPTGDLLYSAVKTLVEDSMVDGLILDIRTNFGGTFYAYYKTFEYLNNGDVPAWVGYADRVNATDKYSLTNYSTLDYYVSDTLSHFFNNPVAILTGPNAGSAGDFLPILFKHDPYVKTFGKSTAGAYGARMPMHFTSSNYGGSRQIGNFFTAADPNYYITHTNFPVDSPAWFNQDSVCSGTDNMVSEAIQWIQSTASAIAPERQSNLLAAVVPNPSNGSANLILNTNVNDHLNISIYNVYGMKVKFLSIKVMPGRNMINLGLEELKLAAGDYCVIINGDKTGTATEKMVIVK